MNPDTGRLEDVCPFLHRSDAGSALCEIHDTKPDMCRDYPTLAHGHRCLRGGFLKMSIAVASCAACECERAAAIIFS